MTIYFKFVRNDKHLIQELKKEELNAIKPQKLDYEFSFHEQHEIGWPVYIIEKNKRGKRRRPKINLKNKTRQQVTIIQGFFDEKKVGLDAKRVVVDNWDIFQKLADHYYRGRTVAKKINFQILPKALFVCNYKPCAHACLRKGGRLYTVVFRNQTLKSEHIKFLKVPGKSIGPNVEHTVFKCKRCGNSLDMARDMEIRDKIDGEVIYIDK